MFIILMLVIIITLIVYDRKKKNYWLMKGVYSHPSTFIIGDMPNLLSSTAPWQKSDKVYQLTKSYDMIGQYELFNPKLMLLNPDLIKNIMVKDFEHFVDRRSFANTHPKDIVARLMVVNATGDTWKSVRSVVTPVFSSGKLKGMFPLIEKEAQTLTDFCHLAAIDGKSINVAELCGKYSLNIIQSCAFGVEGESFKEKPSDIFHLISNMFSLSYIAMLKFMFIMTLPKLFNSLGLYMATANDDKMYNYMQQIIAARRENPTARKDLISCMIESEKEEKQDKDGNYVIDDKVIIAQAILFIAAGFETVKNNLSFIIYNIAAYPEEQEKLREELKQAVYDEGITYQSLQELPYFDAFISETMRVYPSIYMLERCCTKDYNIPNTNITIPKGMLVDIPTYSIHHDPAYWDQPEEFRPSRFLKENKSQINSYAYLPFGLGPRNCLGNRFALLEMKLALAKMLISFDIKLKPGTTLQTTTTIFAYKPLDDNGVQVILNEL